MKVDFHFHACLSKAIPFEYDYFSQTLARAREQNLFAITITDHFDTQGFEHIYNSLDAKYSYNGDYYLAEGVRFYPGMEVEVREGPHLLVYGKREAILAFYERLRPHQTPETFLPVPGFFEKQTGLDLMTIFAHPLRPKREFNRIAPEFASRFEAFDLNAKDLWRFGSEHRVQVEALAAAFNRPVVAGSDTHHFMQLGSIYNEFQQPFETLADLRALIRTGAYTRHIHPELPKWIETAQEIKQAIKAAKYGIQSSKFD